MKVWPEMTLYEFCRGYALETGELVRTIGEDIEARKNLILITNKRSDGSREHRAAAETVLREIKEDAKLAGAMLTRRQLVLESLLELIEPLLQGEKE